MSKVLLTGATGFIGAHILEILVREGYCIVVVVRSDDRGRRIKQVYPMDRVSYTVVNDMTADGAFDIAVSSHPPFDSVIHAASPFHFKATDFQHEILDPAIRGTVGILKSIKAHAPSVKRVVITSSMAALLNWGNPPDVYEESTWNPITQEEALEGPVFAYLASKTFAEKAARDFVRTETPSFDIVSINPPGVYGPTVHDLQSLQTINTSNGIFADILQGRWSASVPENVPTQWVDVRDVALCHVRALQVLEAANRRFIVVAGHASNADIAAIVAERNPDIRSRLPTHFGKPLFGKISRVDTEPARNILGIRFTSLEDSVSDTIVTLAKLAT